MLNGLRKAIGGSFRQLQRYVVDKIPQVLIILFDHLLLTVTNVHRNTHGVQ